MNFECPYCNQPLDSPDDLSGTTVTCPACEKPFQIAAFEPHPRSPAPLSRLPIAGHAHPAAAGHSHLFVPTAAAAHAAPAPHGAPTTQGAPTAHGAAHLHKKVVISRAALSHSSVASAYAIRASVRVPTIVKVFGALIAIRGALQTIWAVVGLIKLAAATPVGAPGGALLGIVGVSTVAAILYTTIGFLLVKGSRTGLWLLALYFILETVGMLMATAMAAGFMSAVPKLLVVGLWIGAIGIDLVALIVSIVHRRSFR